MSNGICGNPFVFHHTDYEDGVLSYLLTESQMLELYSIIFERTPLTFQGEGTTLESVTTLCPAVQPGQLDDE